MKKMSLKMNQTRISSTKILDFIFVTVSINGLQAKLNNIMEVHV